MQTHTGGRKSGYKKLMFSFSMPSCVLYTHNDNRADFAPIVPLPDHGRLSSVL